jgi:hypothetical protein
MDEKKEKEKKQNKKTEHKSVGSGAVTVAVGFVT